MSLNSTWPLFEWSRRLIRQQVKVNRPKKRTMEKQGAYIFMVLRLTESVKVMEVFMLV